MHHHLRTVLVATMTTAGREAPFRIGVTHGGRKGLILLDQVRAVDKTRLAKKLRAVSAKTLTATLRLCKRYSQNEISPLKLAPHTPDALRAIAA